MAPPLFLACAAAVICGLHCFARATDTHEEVQDSSCSSREDEETTTRQNSLLQRRSQASSQAMAAELLMEEVNNSTTKRRSSAKPGGAFEGCPADPNPASWATKSRYELPLVQSGASDCAAQELRLQNADSKGKISSTCCKASSLGCAGCASTSDGVKCAACVGGYQLKDGACSICENSAGWLNDAGDSCYKATCSDKKHRGLSSNHACCKCGGGHREATPFAFNSVNLVLAASSISPDFSPIPRTASKYSVDSECELSKYGLSVNGETGALELSKGCKTIGCGATEPFSVHCTLTAHQTPALDATAAVSVSASRFSYGQTHLIAGPSALTFKPILGVTSASMACVPSSAESWLKVSADGTLTVSSSSNRNDLKKLAGLTGTQMGLVGGRCAVTAIVGNKKAKTMVAVFVPQVWESFSYDVVNVYAAVGESALPMKVTGVSEELLAPSRFSVACESGISGAPFAFDAVTGVATVDGHVAFTLDVASGTLEVAPSKALEKTLDDHLADDTTRKTFSLSCKVYGHYEFLEQPLGLPARMVASPAIKLQLRDNTCWVKRVSNFVGKTKKSSSSDLKSCWRSCRLAPDCTDFAVVSGGCYFMDGLCTRPEETCALKKQSVYTKIPRCGERNTCVAITDSKQGWVSGMYCPVGDSTTGPVYKKEGPTIPDTLYLAKYEKTRDGSKSGCATGRYAIKQADPSQDFDDPESSYIELKGATVKCIQINSDFVDKVFSQGLATAGEIYGEVSGLFCGAPNTTSSDPEADNEEGKEKGTAVATLVIDDPATKEEADHWAHPCECFPETWGAVAPVTDDSFTSVPAGSGNIFTPAPFEIVSGTFTCEDEYIIDGKVIIPDEEDASEPETCEVACKSKSGCLFFFEGEVASQKQCRLYTACNTLVREPGLTGTLKAMPTPKKQYCRVADPEKCWAVSGRRSLLRASRAKDRLSCEWMDLISQCDHKLLMGGAGVEKCARCTYKDAGTQSFGHKTVIPTSFAHGQKLGVSCWQERFRAAPVASGSKSGGETLTCVSGSWMDTSGQPGLSNFACGACLQVVSPPYMQLDSRNQQELYFASILEVQIKTMSKTERSMLRSGVLTGQLDSSGGGNGKDLLHCAGDCDKDADCNGVLRCFQRSGYTSVPGCFGKGTRDWDYCVLPAHIIKSYVSVNGNYNNVLSECQGQCSGDSSCSGSLKCWTAGGFAPGCKTSSSVKVCYDPSNYKTVDSSPGGDGKGKLLEGMGDCDSDSDCQGSLKCFERGDQNPAFVTGLKGTMSKGWDYCYNPSAGGASKSYKYVGNNRRRSASMRLGVCQGDCDYDSDCASGLKCFQRDNGQDAPGCLNRPPTDYDVCYDPNAPKSVTTDNSPGGGGKRKLFVCEGDCDSDDDCQGSLKCFQRDKYEKIPGCRGSGKSGWDYCASYGTKAVELISDPYRASLGECEGDCDSDSHCATGLKCFQRNGDAPIPGCEGNSAKSSWDYCYDPAKAIQLGSDLDLSVVGFVMKTVPTVPSTEKVFESTGSPGTCLEVDPTSGFKATKCSDPPNDRQLISAGDLPKVMNTLFSAATQGLVPSPKDFETSKKYKDAGLKDFLLEQDCEDNALSAFGFRDKDADGKLEIFAACSQATGLGTPSEHVAVLGGELVMEFSTCTADHSDTNANIYYTINGKSRSKLGKTGRAKGDTDKITVSYDEPFEKMVIESTSSDGWKICRIKFAGEEVPTAAIEIDRSELPFWIDTDGGGSTKKFVTISGNRMPQELAFARMECGLGQAMSYIKKEANRFVYRCSYIAGLGACRPWNTEQLDTSSGQFDVLKDLHVVCPEGHVLQSLIAEESTGGQWIRYRYTCCSSAGTPVAVKPTGRFLENLLQDYEGIYCPSHRDDSGRLSFQRAYAFKSSDKSKPSELTYNRNELKWCISPSRRRRGAAEVSCFSSDVANPLDASVAGATFEAVPLSDFDGQFAGAGVGKAAGGGRRKKPELIKFGAIEPKYAEECKDEVTPGTSSFDVELMNKEGLSLPDGNPCKNIAGKWTVSEGPPKFRGGPPTITREGEGSAWSTHGYDGSDTEWGAGTTYDQTIGCRGREISRDMKAADWAHGHDTRDGVMDIAHALYSLPCALAPDVAVAPLGFGPSFPTGGICESILDRVLTGAKFINDQVSIENDFQWAKGDTADCNSLQNFYARTFCDLHCLRDTVKTGDKAILKSLEGAVDVMGKNTDALLEYYSANLQDSIDGLKETKGSSLLEDAETMKGQMDGMFLEMSQMLSTEVTLSGRSTASRALDHFSALFDDSQGFQGGNASTLMPQLLQETENLHSVISLASSDRPSSAAHVASRSASLLGEMQKTLKARVHVIGVYHTLAQDAKARQSSLTTMARQAVTSADVLDEVRHESTLSFLLDLDRTWWALREHLDSYIEKSGEQTKAYKSSFMLLDSYTLKCTAGFSDMNLAYRKAMQAETAAHSQLRRTWTGVSSLLGLLAGQIEDGSAFLRLGRLDVAALSASNFGSERERSVVCAAAPGKEAAALVQKAIEKASKQGLVEQTWSQIRTVFMEMPFLRSRFLNGGLEPPGVQDVLDAWWRVASSYKHAVEQRGTLATEVLERLRRTSCA